MLGAGSFLFLPRSALAWSGAEAKWALVAGPAPASQASLPPWLGSD